MHLQNLIYDIKNMIFYDIAQESMLNSGRVERSLSGSECGISVDGCWPKRSYVSVNGCVAAISIDSGKSLHVEPISRYCKGCQANEKLDKVSEKYRIWEANHVSCKANFKATAPAMEAEGAERIFMRSVKKNALY